MAHKVLVAEDDAPTLALMREIFSLHGISVRVMHDAVEATALLDGEKFDAVFTGMEMPRLNGLDFIRQIRQSSWNKNTPIVVIPERGETQSRLEAFQAGGTFFLEKPLDRTLFTRLLRTTRPAIAEERRRSVRIPLVTLVTCRTGSHEFTGLSSNISRDGICFQSDGSLRRGHRIELSFALQPHQPPLSAIGVVTRTDLSHAAGVRFIPMEPDDAQRIRNFISKQVDSL